MENYNLTAELKKIASGINTSDPNTELGNINSGVGNLDTAMQGVATAINGISIPNPGSNIDGVATAINNKTLPDPSSNITAVATAVDNLAGGKDLGDIETILTTMNGNIANLGSDHIVSIDVAPAGSTGYIVRYGNGIGIPLSNKASKTSYTDTNNLGATDVQGAIDKITGYDTLWSGEQYATGTLPLSSSINQGDTILIKFRAYSSYYIKYGLVFVDQSPANGIQYQELLWGLWNNTMTYCRYRFIIYGSSISVADVINGASHTALLAVYRKRA